MRLRRLELPLSKKPLNKKQKDKGLLERLKKHFKGLKKNNAGLRLRESRRRPKLSEWLRRLRPEESGKRRRLRDSPKRQGLPKLKRWLA